ncbi:MAG: glycosyltransferase family 4 protein [Nitrospirota bacterium]|nr:MAG: glycosyltransferase family 4 protein [Nitrospirota bacterium]
METVSEPRKPRVLLAAYQCGPGMGSVSQIGWEWYARVSRRLPTTLITHVRNQKAIEAAGMAPNADIVYVDTEWFAGPLYRLATRLFPKSQHTVFLLSSLDFFLFDRQAKRMIQKRMNGGETWDLIHVVTPLTMAAPTCLHQLQLPLIRGPLNSGLGVPKAFSSVMKEDSAWLYPMRNISRIIDSMVGSTRHSSMILTATRATVEAVPKKYRGKCHSMLENGVDLSRFTNTPWPSPPSLENPLNILFVGRLVPVKGIPFLLKALAQVKGKIPVQARIVGEGPMEEEWKRIARDCGVADLVYFLGNRSLDEVAEELRTAHVLCLPSIRESGGAVLLEAMAMSRPVIAVAFGGPAELVDKGVGEPIEPSGPEAVVNGLARAFTDLVRDPESWRQRGEEGRRRAEQQYGWEAKVEAAVRLYDRVLGK